MPLPLGFDPETDDPVADILGMSDPLLRGVSQRTLTETEPPPPIPTGIVQPPQFESPIEQQPGPAPALPAPSAPTTPAVPSGVDPAGEVLGMADPSRPPIPSMSGGAGGVAAAGLGPDDPVASILGQTDPGRIPRAPTPKSGVASIGSTLADIGVGISSSVVDVFPEFMARFYRASGPQFDGPASRLDAFIAEQKADQERKRLAPEDAEQRMLLFGLTRGGIREGLAQFGNSIPSMILGWIGRIGGAALGGALGIETGPGAIATAYAGAVAGGMLGMAPMYWMKKDQVIEDALAKAREENPNLTRREWERMLPEIEKVASEAAWNEVLPEMATAGIQQGLLKWIGRAPGVGKLIARVGESAIADALLEIGGEAVTEKLDANTLAKLGMDEPITWGEAVQRVWEPTLVMSLFSMGIGTVGTRIEKGRYNRFASKSIAAMEESGISESIINDFRDAKGADEWAAVENRHAEAIIRHVVNDVARATVNNDAAQRATAEADARLGGAGAEMQMEDAAAGVSFEDRQARAMAYVDSEMQAGRDVPDSVAERIQNAQNHEDLAAAAQELRAFRGQQRATAQATGAPVQPSHDPLAARPGSVEDQINRLVNQRVTEYSKPIPSNDELEELKQRLMGLGPWSPAHEQAFISGRPYPDAAGAAQMPRNAPASVPVMITQEMRRELGVLGFTPGQIDRMRPAEANQVLQDARARQQQQGGQPQQSGAKPAVSLVDQIVQQRAANGLSPLGPKALDYLRMRESGLIRGKLTPDVVLAFGTIENAAQSIPRQHRDVVQAPAAGPAARGAARAAAQNPLVQIGGKGKAFILAGQTAEGRSILVDPENQSEPFTVDAAAVTPYTGPRPSGVAGVTAQPQAQTATPQAESAERTAAAAQRDKVYADPKGKLTLENLPRPKILAPPPNVERFEAVAPKGNLTVRGYWTVVPRSTLITSDMPGYTKKLQPRTRGTKTSDAQVFEIAKRLDYQQLLDSRLTSMGSPMVFETAEVGSGNGRTMARELAATLGTDAKYNEVAREKARKLGIADADTMDMPVAVRVIDEISGDIEDFVELSNHNPGLTRTRAEIAKADARILLETNLMDLFDVPEISGDVLAASNRNFLTEFVRLTRDESLIRTNGKFDDEALRPRVNYAVLTAILGENEEGFELARDIIEKAHGLGMGRVSSGLMRAGGDLIRLAHEKPEYNIIPQLSEAMRRFASFRSDMVEGKTRSFDAWLAQQDFFDNPSPKMVAILTELEWRNKRGIGTVTKFFREYARQAEKIDTTTVNMFADSLPDRTAMDIIRDAQQIGRDDAEQTEDQDFAPPGPSDAEEEPGQGPARVAETGSPGYRVQSEVGVEPTARTVVREVPDARPLAQKDGTPITAYGNADDFIEKTLRAHLAADEQHRETFADMLASDAPLNPDAIEARLQAAEPKAEINRVLTTITNNRIPARANHKMVELGFLEAGKDYTLDEWTDAIKSAHMRFAVPVKPGESRKWIFTQGGPAAGKTSKMKEVYGVNPDRMDQTGGMVIVSADSTRALFGPYQDLVSAGAYDAAGYVHEYASGMANELLADMIESDYSVIFDGVLGKASKARDVVQKIRAADEAAGRPRSQINLVAVTVDPDLAAKRALMRGLDKESDSYNRFVPVDTVVRDGHQKANAAFWDVLDLFDQIDLYDNTAFPGKRVAQKRGGTLDILVKNLRLLMEERGRKNERTKNNAADDAGRNPELQRGDAGGGERPGGQDARADATASTDEGASSTGGERAGIGVAGVSPGLRTDDGQRRSVLIAIARRNARADAIGRLIDTLDDAEARHAYSHIVWRFFGSVPPPPALSTELTAERGADVARRVDAIFYRFPLNRAELRREGITAEHIRQALKDGTTAQIKRLAEFLSLNVETAPRRVVGAFRLWNIARRLPPRAQAYLWRLAKWSFEGNVGAQPKPHGVLPRTLLARMNEWVLNGVDPDATPPRGNTLRESSISYAQPSLFDPEVIEFVRKQEERPRGNTRRNSTRTGAEGSTRTQSLFDFGTPEGGSNTSTRSRSTHPSRPLALSPELRADVSLAQPATGDRVQNAGVRSGSKPVAGLAAPANAGLDLFEWSRVNGVVPESPRRDASTDKSPAYPTRNYDLRGRAPVLLTKGQRNSINARARDILARLDTEGGDSAALTDDERNILRQYTGEGGLSSGTEESLTQHYTSYDTIEAIYSALESAGVRMDNALEPAVGAGNFVGLRPRLNWTTVDIDPTNMKIVGALYPDAKRYHMSFELLKQGGYDLIISNVPFLETRGADRLKNRPDIKALHDFYFAHALTLVKPGGVVAFITSNLTMDKKGKALRAELMEKSDVIGAFRFPVGHFRANAHTDVMTDVIFLQKRPDGVAATPEQAKINAAFVETDTNAEGRTLNTYYRMNPENILGTLEEGVDKLHGGRPIYNVTGDADLSRIAVAIRKFENLDAATAKPSTLPRMSADATNPPADSMTFAKWAQKNGYIARSRVNVQKEDGGNQVVSTDGVERNVFIDANGTVWRSGGVVDFEDVTGHGKWYQPLSSTLGDRVVALQRLADLAAAAQDKSSAVDDPVGEATRLIEEYRDKYHTHPTQDKALKSLLAKPEPSMWAELTTLFDKEWKPADVFSRQTRFSDSGRFRATREDPIALRAKASENARGVIELDPKAEGERLIDQGELWNVIGEGYSIIESVDGRHVLQNDIFYYSGNVYSKMDAAMAAMQRTTDTEIRDQLQRQHDRLESMRPVPKSLEEISFKGTEDWIYGALQGSDISDYFSVFADKDKEGRRIWRVKRIPGKWGLSEIVENFLNNKQLVNRLQTKDGEPQETNQQFLQRLKKADEDVREFYAGLKEMIRQDPELAARVELAYNRRFRSYVRPDYARAQYLIQDVLDEMKANGGKSLRQNQTEWVAQAVSEGRGINAHDVGGGKTLSAIASARALKLRGAAHKPLFVVPAKVIHKWERDIRGQFPSAKIVNLGKLDAATRTQRLFELANTEADFVLISHEGFAKIDIPAEAEGRFVEELLQEHVDDPGVSGRGAGKLAQKMSTLRRIVMERPRDDRLTMDKLGIDALFVDEAHNFKNVGVRSELVRYGLGKGFDVDLRETKVKGPDGKPIMVDSEEPGTGKIVKRPMTQEDAVLGSARAYDMRFKANYISDRNNGRNVFLLTATPTPNKPIEVYTMLRHLSSDIFDEYGIHNDREFSDTFFDLGTVEDPQNDQRSVQVLRGIRNAQDLRGILNRYVDKVPVERMPWIKVPSENVVRHLLAQSDPYAIIQTDLDRRRKDLKPAREIQAGDDTMAAIYSAARAASVDPRLYGGTHAAVTIDARTYETETDKIEAVIQLVAHQHEKDGNAGQLIFLDASGHSSVDRGALGENLHAEIKRQLVERGGYRPEQIAIINGKVVTDPKTGNETASGDRDAKKQAIVDAYTKGDILVVIGTTTSMGEGMGLQKRTTDIYNLDLPWTPGAIRQRHGRGVRQGNPYPEVRTHLFLMRGTFDALSYSVIANKKGWNEAMWDKEVSDYISTAEEMAGGAMPPREQILIELESSPAKKAELILRFKRESILRKLGEANSVVAGYEGRVAKAKLELEELRETESKREKALRTLVPNAKIKDPAQRAEAFEKSKAWAQSNLEVTRRRIAEMEHIQDQAAQAARATREETKATRAELDAFDRQFFDPGSDRVRTDNPNAVIRDYYRGMGMDVEEEQQSDVAHEEAAQPAMVAESDRVTRESAARYLERTGAASGPSDALRLAEAVEAIQAIPNTPYLPGFSGGTEAAATEQVRPKLRVLPRLGARQEAATKAIREPALPDGWKEWAEAHEGERVWRASSILPQMIKDPQPVDITGMEIRTSRDFAAATMFMRDPRMERMFGIYLDKNGHAIGPVNIFTVGILDASLVHPAVFMRNKPADAVSIVIGHNHPSGDPTASPEDIRITRQVIDSVGKAGLDILDHVIINGGKYFSLRENGMVLFESFTADQPPRRGRPKKPKLKAPALAEGALSEWETVARDVLSPVRDPKTAGTLFDAMRSGAPGRINVLLLTRKYTVTGAISFSADATVDELNREIFESASKNGAAAYVIDLPFKYTDTGVANTMLRHLIERAKANDIEILDARTLNVKSVRESGMLIFSESPGEFRLEGQTSEEAARDRARRRAEEQERARQEMLAKREEARRNRLKSQLDTTGDLFDRNYAANPLFAAPTPRQESDAARGTSDQQELLLGERKPRYLTGIGVVDANGAVQFRQLTGAEFSSDAAEHRRMFGTVQNNGRFRMRNGTVVWDTDPTLDEINAVENLVARRGGQILEHVDLSGNRVDSAGDPDVALRIRFAAREPQQNDARLSAQPRASQGISTEQTRAAIAGVARKLGFDVSVVQNLDALSDADRANISRAMRSQGVSGARGIFMPDGRVILIADNIATPAEAVQTLIHETFERGFANLPKAETTAILNDIFKGSLNRKAIYEQATARVKKNYPNLATTEALQSPEGRAAFMREVLAHIAENRTQMPTLWQRVIRAIQNALIRLTKGTALEGTFGDANTAQIETLIDRALRRGASPEIGSQSAPNFQALGNRGVGTERGAQYSAALSRVQDMLRHGGTEVAADPKWKAKLDRLGRDREAALADTRNATDPNGTAYTDMTGEEEWIEEKSEEDRREFIEDDYRAIEEEIEQDAENDTALLQAAATNKKNDEIVGAVADVVESIGADMGTVEVERHRARSGSTYLTMEAGDADLTIRIADHRQVRGGGRIEGDATTARRAGESDIDVVVSGNKVDVYTREGSRWTYKETASDISSLKDIIESKLDAAETATQDDSDIRFAAQDNSMPDSPESFEARLDDLTQRLQAAKSRAAREVIKRERAEQTIEYLRAQANNIVAAQKGLVAYMRRARIPQAERANMITRLTDLAKFKTRDALARHYRAAIAEVDRISDWHEGREIREQIGELLAANAVKLSRKFPTGTRTPETYRTIAQIREIAGMSREQLTRELEAMEARANAAGAENIAYAALSDEDAARQALLNTFAGVMLNRQGEAWRTHEETQAALEELERLVREGMTGYQAKQAAFRAETEALRSDAINIVTGGRGLKPQPKRFGQERTRKTFMDKLRSFATLHLSWEWLLDYISSNDRGSKQLESGLQVHARDAKAAADAEARGIQARVEEIQAASERIFGVKGRALTKRMQENSRVVKETGVFVGGEQLSLSQNEAYHLWQMYFQPNLQVQDKDGVTILQKLGWTEEVRDQLEAFMKPEVKQWAEWQMREFYENEYHRINEVFRDLYSADLPHNPNYAPAPREYTSSRDADNLLGHEQRRATVFTGSLLNRVENLRNLKIVDGDQLLMQHVFEMEHFISHGRLMRKLRATIGHQDVLTAIEHYYPEGAATRVRRFMNAFARGGEEKSAALGLIQKMRRNFSQAVNSSPTTMLKQFASIPYMALEVPSGDFASGFAWIMRQPWKAFGLFREIMNESAMMQDRYGSGWERDFRLAMMRTVPKRLGGIKTIADAAGIFTAIGDKGAAFFGGIPVYRYHLKKNLAAGMSEATAKAEALKAFENAVERTQQSGRTIHLGEIQRDPVGSMFTMFMTQPTAIFRYTLGAIRNYKAGRMTARQAARQIFVANVLGPAVFGFVSAGLRWGIGGDDDDDDTLTVGGMPKEVALQVLTSPFQGLVLAAPIAEAIARNVTYGYTLGDGIGSDLLPWTDTLDSFVGVATKTFKSFEGGDIDPETAGKAFDDLLELAGKATGIPIDPVRRSVTGAMAAIEGDTDYPIRRMIGFSKYTLGEGRTSKTPTGPRLPKLPKVPSVRR